MTTSILQYCNDNIIIAILQWQHQYHNIAMKTSILQYCNDNIKGSTTDDALWSCCCTCCAGIQVRANWNGIRSIEMDSDLSEMDSNGFKWTQIAAAPAVLEFRRGQTDSCEIESNSLKWNRTHWNEIWLDWNGLKLIEMNSNWLKWNRTQRGFDKREDDHDEKLI